MKIFKFKQFTYTEVFEQWQRENTTKVGITNITPFINTFNGDVSENGSFGAGVSVGVAVVFFENEPD